MHYVERAPSPRLRGRLTYWRLTGHAAESQELEPVLPDGCVEIVVHLGDPFFHQEGGRVALQPRVLLAGPGTAPVRLAPSGRIDVIGVRMEAGVAASLLETSPVELVDRVVEPDAVAAPLVRDLAEELAEPRRGELWTDVLERRFGGARDGDPAVDGAVARVRASGGRVTVDELARATGLSARQLERRFRARVGLGPKMLARLSRFQSAWRLLTSPKAPSIAAVAARTGYYDQAHLVRDFQQFAGAPPSRFLREEHELARRFAAGE